MTLTIGPVRTWLFTLAVVLSIAIAPPALAQTQAPDGIGVDEHLGAELPLDVYFRDHTGRTVSLKDYFDGKRPVIVVFGYHSCPMLCGLIQGAVVDALRDSDLSVGKDFDVVVISIDPKDTPAVAAAHRGVIVARYVAARRGRWTQTQGDEGWHYLVGDEPDIKAVTSAAGYRYAYDREHDQYGHPAVVLVATPTGRVARYLYGVEFSPRDVRFGLLEASEGRSVSTIDRILLYCVHYDPVGGGYRVVVSHVMRVGGAAIALLLGAFLGTMWARERRNAGRRAAHAAGATSG